MIITKAALPARTVPDGGAGSGVSARDVGACLYAELSAAGVHGLIFGAGGGLAVLAVADDFALWTDGRRIWWREGGTWLRFHQVTDLRDVRRLVLGHYHGLRRLSSVDEARACSVDETRAAGERLQEGLAGHGIARQDMDVFLDSRVAVIYAYGERWRVTITIADGTYSWPATAVGPGRPGCLRCRSWHDVAETAAEISGQLFGRPAHTDPE